MAFERLESYNKSEYVYAQIIKEIESGHYGIGDKLPSEQDLGELAGVSRASVREALSALRLVGMIETRKGNGTYVKSNKLSIGAEIHAGFDHGVNTFEVLEARKVIEPAVARLALEMMTDAHLEKIHIALELMAKDADNKDYDSYHRANKKFHEAIAEVTHNASLINYTRSLQSVFIESDFGAELRRKYLTEEAYVRDAILIHQEIYNALAVRNEKQLDEAYQRHNEGVEKQLLGR